MHPVLLRWNGPTIYSYGFCMAIAMLIIYLVAWKRSRAFGIEPNDALEFIFVFFIAGIIGSRLFYVMQYLTTYWDAPWKIFMIYEGGLVWHGGFLVAAMSGFWMARKKGLPVLTLCDFFAPLIPLGHAIGRVGCFLNGCCYGRITTTGYGILFPGDFAERIPVQHYAAGFLITLSLFLFWLSSKKHSSGQILLDYILLYSMFRFFIEFYRGDQVAFLSLTPPQWTCIFLFIVALVMTLVLRKSWTKR